MVQDRRKIYRKPKITKIIKVYVKGYENKCEGLKEHVGR